MNTKQKTLAMLSIVILTMPLIANGAVFEDPVQGLTIRIFMERLLSFIVGLMGLIALLAIVYGGAMIVLGGMKSEQDLKRGKEIILWALIGLLITGMAVAILKIVGGTFLGLTF